MHANFIKQTLPEDATPTAGPDAAKRWKDIWSAGQGVSLIQDVAPIEEIVQAIAREYHDAAARLQ